MGGHHSTVTRANFSVSFSPRVKMSQRFCTKPMVTVVLMLNGLIAALCWYVVWQVWMLRRTLSDVADALLVAEENTHNVLYGAPEAIATAQKGTYQLRQSYQRLLVQIVKLQQVLALLTAGQSAWRWVRQRSRSSRSRPSSRRDRPFTRSL